MIQQYRLKQPSLSSYLGHQEGTMSLLLIVPAISHRLVRLALASGGGPCLPLKRVPVAPADRIEVRGPLTVSEGSPGEDPWRQ